MAQALCNFVQNKYDGSEASSETFTKLVEKYISSINGKDMKNGRNALQIASRNGSLELCRILIEKGADIESRSQYGSTPLHFAADYGHLAICSLLLEKGADTRVQNNEYASTPLHLAADKGYGEVCSLLLEKGADIGMKDKGSKRFYDYLKGKPTVNKVIYVDTVYSLSALEANDYGLWFHIIQTEDIEGLVDVVAGYIHRHPHLASAKDSEGRVAVDVALLEYKKIMRATMLWHGRYRLMEYRPEHISKTCLVFKAFDEQSIDENGKPLAVALKLMRHKSQFLREVNSRKRDLSPDFIVSIFTTYPPMVEMPSSLSISVANEEIGANGSGIVLDPYPSEIPWSISDGNLTKDQAEQLFCIVMPLADRNMFVAMKQERFAELQMDEVRHIFVQVTKCVEHLHKKGLLHGDIKPLNMVRAGARWKLIDLDASCSLGVERVGDKSSSAYVPPEAVYTDVRQGVAYVRTLQKAGSSDSSDSSDDGAGIQRIPNLAHPSFDVWSLGCFLYQLCSRDGRPLFFSGLDDNLSDRMDQAGDSLWTLSEWNTEKAAAKLADVPDYLARNLLSQILQRNPEKRPTLARILAHPFLTNRSFTRLVGEEAQYDVFLSYRVSSDLEHAERLYNLLTANNLKVWWDKKSLVAGVDWKEGFCAGLVGSRSFVCLLSRDAINHPSKPKQNYSKLTADSPCDNVLLEQRLAVELEELGLIEKIFPIMIGDVIEEATYVSSLPPSPEPRRSKRYSNYFNSNCHPTAPDIAVRSIETDLIFHLDSQALGAPLRSDMTVASILGALTAHQGRFIEGEGDVAFRIAAEDIAKVLIDNAIDDSTKVDTGHPPPNTDIADQAYLVRNADMQSQPSLSEKKLASDVEVCDEKWLRLETLAAEVGTMAIDANIERQRDRGREVIAAVGTRPHHILTGTDMEIAEMGRELAMEGHILATYVEGGDKSKVDEMLTRLRQKLAVLSKLSHSPMKTTSTDAHSDDGTRSC